MNIEKKNLFLFLIIIFLIYCSINIGTMWDSGTHMQQGKNKLEFIFSFGKIKNEFWFSKFFPGISYTITAFLSSLAPRAYQSEALHLINMLISLSAVFALSNLFKILFNKTSAKIIFILFILYPAFFGHMAINPKDTIILVSNIWITYFVIKYLYKNNKIKNKKKYILKVGFFIALGTGVTLGFAATLFPLLIFVLLEIFYFKKLSQKINKKIFFLDLTKIILFSYFFILIFWPQAHGNIFIIPFKIFIESINNPPVGAPANLFNGVIYLTGDPPKTYVLLSLILRTPEYILLLYLFSFYLIIFKNNYYKKIFKNFNYKLYFVFLILFLNIFMLTFSPYPMYDGMRKFIFVIPFFLFIPALSLFYLIENRNKLISKIKIFSISILAIIFLYKFISLTPYHYVYINYINGQTQNNYKKFENDYLTTSVKELLKKSKFLDSNYTKLKYCGIGKGKIKRYLKEYGYSKIKLVNWNDDYDYVIMTNRVNWNDLEDVKTAKTCFESFNGEVVSDVKRNNLILSSIKKK